MNLPSQTLYNFHQRHPRNKFIPHSHFSLKMLPWRTASNTLTPSEPLPKYTNPKLPPHREETNDHTRFDHSSTNSSFVDIELGNMSPPSAPLPAYTDPRLPPNSHARVANASTNSPSADIELGIIPPPRPPPRSHLATFRAAASTLTAPFSARAATSTGGSQAASGQATAPQRRPPWYRRPSSRDELDYLAIMVAATVFGLVLFAIMGFGYLIYIGGKNGTGEDL